MTRQVILAVVATVAGCFYLWLGQAAGEPYYWGYDLTGYYNLLAQAVVRGQLHLPVEPAPGLLALPDPWDYRANAQYRQMADVVLYNRHYYLYHGVAPAVLLFAPWRLMTGHDVPENFAVVVFCFGGFLFSARALLRLLELAGADPGPLALSVLLAALGFCQCAPYLLNRVFVYEVAIGGGYFCLSGAVFYLTMSIGSSQWGWRLLASGLLFGLAIGCRPHLGLAGLLAAAGLAWSRCGWRRLAVFLTPLLLVCLGIAAYNHLRFGNPLEFGNRFLLAAGANQQEVRLALRNVLPGLYYMLFCQPEFSPVFPWIRTAFRPPFNSDAQPFPGFVEPVAGALYLAPFLLALFFPAIHRGPDRNARMVIAVMLCSVCGILAFVSTTGLVAQRYEVDFLPLAALAATVSLGVYLAGGTRWRRGLAGAGLAASVGFGLITNLALGIAGPYDGILRNRPDMYVRMAGWLSPLERFRPMLNPRLDLTLSVQFEKQPDGFREPLAISGGSVFMHFFYVEHHDGKLRLVSKADTSTATHEMEHPGAKPVRIRLLYDPASHRMSAEVNGQEVLAHEVRRLVLAPSQLTIGLAHTDLPETPLRFTGRIEVLQRTVEQAHSTAMTRSGKASSPRAGTGKA